MPPVLGEELSGEGSGLPLLRLRGACRRPPSAEAAAEKVEGRTAGGLVEVETEMESPIALRCWRHWGGVGEPGRGGVGEWAPRALLVSGPDLCTWALQKDHVKKFRCRAASP